MAAPQPTYRLEVRGLPRNYNIQAVALLVGVPFTPVNRTATGFDISNLYLTSAQWFSDKFSRITYPGTSATISATIVDDRSGIQTQPRLRVTPPAGRYQLVISGLPFTYDHELIKDLIGFEVGDTIMTPGRYIINRIDQVSAEQAARILDQRSYPGSPNFMTAIVLEQSRTLNIGQSVPQPHGPGEISFRRCLLVEELIPMIQSGQITQSIVDPENQREVPRGLARVTLIGVDGQEYDVLARYDPQTQQISPPQ